MSRHRKSKSQRRHDSPRSVSLAALRLFFTEDALKFFTTIYLHDVAYHIYDQKELEDFLARLPSEPEEVQKAVLDLASRYRPRVPTENNRHPRLASLVQFATRALCDVAAAEENPDQSRTNAWNTTPVPLRSTGEVQA